MRTLMLGGFAAIVISSAAPAAPLNPTAIQPENLNQIEQVRLVCNEWGRCWRVRGPRYGYGYGPGYGYGRSYNYYSGPRYHHHHGGPGIGFSFRSW